MITGIIGLAIVVLMLAFDRRLRASPAAASLARGKDDRRSSVLLGATHGTAMLLLILGIGLNWFGVARLGASALVGWFGIVLELAGIGLRFRANRVLGQYYTRTLQVQNAQPIIREGPYALIRHPGYLGAMALWFGAALAVMNWVPLLLIPLLMLVAYLYRIRMEEAMMARNLGEPYVRYQRTTWRLIPFLY